MRKAEVFFDAITNIKADLIDDALDHRFRRRTHHWQRYVSMAACLALVATVGFAALRLGVLGGVGGSSNAAADTTINSSVSSSTSSSSSSSAASGAADTSEDQESVTVDSAASRPNSVGREEQKAESVSFRATVLDIGEGWLLTEPFEGEEIRASSDRIMVSLADVEDLPVVQKKDPVTIWYSGMIRESYPAQVSAIRVELLTEQKP